MRHGLSYISYLKGEQEDSADKIIKMKNYKGNGDNIKASIA